MSTSFALSPELVGYLAQVNPVEHPSLEACRIETARHPYVRMQVSREQAAFMGLLVRLTGAKRAVEVGVFTGYSAIATALALKDVAGDDAKLYALDVSTEYTDLAKPHFRSAGVDGIVDLRIGPASEGLARLATEGLSGTLDMAFVDADKTGYPDYYEKVLGLLRHGGLALFDNVLWSGRVADPSDTDPDTVALRKVAEIAKADPRVEAAMIAVGDGVLMVRKR